MSAPESLETRSSSAAAAAGTVPGRARPQVLYIEDEPLNAELMRALFDRRPHLELIVAADGATAAAIAPTISPQLLLVDLRLPDCLGSELLPLLRLRFGWREVRAVAVTAEHGFGVGSSSFAEVWHKPMDLVHVLRRLDEWLPPDTSD
ncbi:response regulator [Rubrivivax gelatinosus]|nr:response regulator [Rubrivivax gelatinosus]